ncbi:uncharacterized protein LOC114745017 [Neltuma alba]|uniref:uncharacterized protein LOC114745017 n=1 Tax=Neltuma alba TaxID=207710 RepID=UPI0010A3401A|nr:uncharacterized protein LOC114745017 [Prosopis alba]
MLGFSAVDGFMETSECLAEMIKYLANEPSVGLFFIQQHTQKAVPNVTTHKKSVVEKARETSLHAEDLEDSITMMRSMKECGFPIVEEMIRDVKKSLVTVTTKKPKRGLINQLSSTNLGERMVSWGSPVLDSQEAREKSGYNFSSVFTTAKQKSRNLLRPQLDDRRSVNSKLSDASTSTASALQSMETDEIPLSTTVEDESQQHEQTDDKLLQVSEKYNDFKAIKEAQLQKWLEGTGNHDDNGQADDAEKL